MTVDINIENSIIPISSANLVRVGSSIEIANKIIKEHEKRTRDTNVGSINEGNEAYTIKLTYDILETLSPSEIIYAELASFRFNPGGYKIGIMIYVTNKVQLICYETSETADKALFIIAYRFLSNNIKTFFNPFFCEEGWDYHVFINKNVELKIKQEYFAYLQNGFEYKIYSSVKGVFNSVVNRMNNPNNETH